MQYSPGQQESKNFYENSFKQLSEIQQRQVGLLVGAAVADAAARPLEGYSADEIAARAARVKDEIRTFEASEGVPAMEDAYAFATDVEPRGEALFFCRAPGVGPERAQGGGFGSPAAAPALATHSFTYLLQADLVRTMARARGDFPLAEVQPLWTRTAGGVDGPGVVAASHGSLLHTLAALLPLPAIYPYASDAALRDCARPFAEALTTGADPDCAAFACDAALSVLGVALRCLQQSPDATRNAALRSLPGAAPAFPPDVRALCPSASRETTERWARCERLYASPPSPASASASPSPLLPRRPPAVDAAAVSSALDIARRARSFRGGVRAAIAAGGPGVCQRAMLVGALVGCRLGVRRIPPEWVSATPDYRTVNTFAIDVAQWSWNPPHH